MDHEKFDWAAHVGRQTPEEFRQHARQQGQGLPIAVRKYMAAVRAGRVFGEPVALADEAEQAMVAYIRASCPALPRRGGRRPGTGTVDPQHKASVSAWITPTTRDQLDQLASQTRKSRAALIAEAVARMAGQTRA